MRAPTPTRTDRAGPDIRWLGALFVLGLGIGLLWETPVVHEVLGQATVALNWKRPASAQGSGMTAWNKAAVAVDPQQAALERENDPVVLEDEKVLQRLMADAAASE